MTCKESIEQFEPMIRHLSNSISCEGTGVFDKDDLYQWGMIALIELAERIEKDKEGTCSFVYQRVKGGMFDGMRSILHNRRQYKIQTLPIDISTFNVKELAAKECNRDGLQVEDFFDFICKRLDKIDKYILKHYYVYNKYMWEIANDLGLCEARVSQRHALAIQILKSDSNITKEVFV